MVIITEKKHCCGCGACAQKCPKQSISMVEDKEGFLYPVVDETTCINCGLCKKVCHELYSYSERRPLRVLATINKSDEIRKKSSSGGMFHSLAEKVLSQNGIVFGAKFDKNWNVVIDYVEEIDAVSALMGSKYVQAKVGNTYRQAEEFLKKGRLVLYSGTPCQITGLLHFLNREYDNLITVDVVCHGVPSPKVWRLYLNEITCAVNNITNVNFRKKQYGWKKFNFQIEYKDGNIVSISSPHFQNDYMRAFLSNLILRPSCYDCKAKGGRSKSDITIADFWGVEKDMPEMDDDGGTSLVLINTKKGESIVDYSRLKYKECTLQQMLDNNMCFAHSVKEHSKRASFFKSIDKDINIISLINKSLRPPLKARTIIKLRSLKNKCMEIAKYVWGGVPPKNKLDNMSNVAEKTCHNYEISNISFREKINGWKHYNFQITFDNDN